MMQQHKQQRKLQQQQQGFSSRSSSRSPRPNTGLGVLCGAPRALQQQQQQHNCSSSSSSSTRPSQGHLPTPADQRLSRRHLIRELEPFSLPLDKNSKVLFKTFLCMQNYEFNSKLSKKTATAAAASEQQPEQPRTGPTITKPPVHRPRHQQHQHSSSISSTAAAAKNELWGLSLAPRSE
ncbi:hypothetical protein ACSSS7_008034 [Eimeria intestinalis]